MRFLRGVLPLNISQCLNWGGAYLSETGSESCRLDAEVLLAYCTGRDRVGLYRDSRQEVSAVQEEKFRRLVKRRGLGEPIAYITGRKEFMGLDFEVTPDVLIPRPETELLVEKALEIIKPLGCADFETGGAPVVVDVGAGCGAIAIALAVAVKSALVYALDISARALEVAGRNAMLNGVAGRVRFFRGDLLAPLLDIPDLSVDLITANLPYIPSGEIHGLMPGVKDYEPRLALDGGKDGMDLYMRLVPQAAALLSAGGRLLMEIAPGQETLMQRIPGNGWRWEVCRDLAGRERLIIAEKMGFGGRNQEAE